MNRLDPMLDPISKKLTMYLLQAVIIGSVVAHNEYYHWTPNRVAGDDGSASAWGFRGGGAYRDDLTASRGRASRSRLRRTWPVLHGFNPRAGPVFFAGRWAKAHEGARWVS